MGKGSNNHKIRNKKIIMESMTGKTNSQIAQSYSMSEVQISNIINHSEEALDLRARVNSEFSRILPDAMKAIKQVMNHDDPSNYANRLKAAEMVLQRTIGKVADKIESHSTHEIIARQMSDEELFEKVKEEVKLLEEERTIKHVNDPANNS